jgi:uncharacterized protein (TIGR02145 family)
MKNNIIKTILLALLISFGLNTIGQIAINTDGSSPNASAMLDVKSTDKGFLPPCMTASQMNALSSPVDGLTVYNTDVEALCVYNGSKWDCMDAQSLFDKTFFCGDNLKDLRDGQSYSTVLIGTQCWMAENLNIGTMLSSSNQQTNNDTIEKYCYNDSTSYCDTYGGLYQWNEMMQYVNTEGTQGICPTGWHLPTDAEWKTMEMALGMSQDEADKSSWRGTDEGGKMKETGTTHWASPNTGATNTSGFTALPGGYWHNGSHNLTNSANLWSSSEYNSSDRWYRSLGYFIAKVNRAHYDKTFGRSVRCLRD